MSPSTMLEEMGAWLATLPPDFAFLLATPAIVALAAFVAHSIPRGGRTPGVSRRAPRRPAGTAGPSLPDRPRPA